MLECQVVDGDVAGIDEEPGFAGATIQGRTICADNVQHHAAG
jgi:hypothetical protein